MIQDTIDINTDEQIPNPDDYFDPLPPPQKPLLSDYDRQMFLIFGGIGLLWLTGIGILVIFFMAVGDML